MMDFRRKRSFVGLNRLSAPGRLSPITIGDNHLLDAVGAGLARCADGA
jgi:hypothetical protein